MKKDKFLFLLKEIINDIFRKYRYKLFLLLVLSTIVGLTEGLSMILLLPLLITMGIKSESEDSYIFTQTNKIIEYFNLDTSLIVMITLLFIVLLFQLLFVVIQNWFLAWFQRDYAAYWRNLLFKSYLHSKFEFFQNQKLGEFTNLMIMETDRICNSFMILMQVFASIISIIIYMSIAFMISFEITISIIVVACFLLICVKNISKKNYSIGTELGPLTSHLTSKITDFFSNLKLIKVTSTEKFALKEIEDIVSTLKFKHTLSTFLPSLVKAIFEFGAFACLCFILIFSFYYLNASSASILVIVGIFVRLLPRLNSLQLNTQILANYLPAFSYTKNKVELALLEKEKVSKSKINKFETKKIDKIIISISKAGYNKKVLIKNIDLKLPEKGLISIIGESGSGKSTLINTLLGLTNLYDGDIKLGELSIRTVPLQEWRKFFGYVPQETLLFNSSILENISWVKRSAKKSEIINASKSALAHNFIMKQEKKYQTSMGENGLLLSGGERQRIAIARALITNPKILIMDESTNALDKNSEKKVIKTINLLRKKTCVINISHNLNNIQNSDLIIYMKDGTCLDSGNWKDLLKRRSSFYDYIQTTSEIG